MEHARMRELEHADEARPAREEEPATRGSGARQAAVEPGERGTVEPEAEGGSGFFDAINAGLVGGGSALPPALRAKFQRSLGVDLAGVRLHTGPASDAASRAMSARAFAVGDDVHFGA